MFTIPKLTSTAKVDGKYSYDRSNPLGTIDFIDGKKAIATIISQCSRDNVNSFIKSIVLSFEPSFTNKISNS